MNISLFNKLYWLRSEDGQQRLVKGYLVSDKKDGVVSIHVHPLGTDAIQALPEGERKLKRLEGHGSYKLNTGDQGANKKGDLLYYHGDWYECLSCQLHDHTMLAHFNYQFVIVPKDASGATDLKPPAGPPTKDDLLPETKMEEGGGDP